MKPDTRFAIVIGRQFGSGGKELGSELAARLAIPCFDKTLLSEAAQRFGFKKEILANADEKKPSVLRSFLNCNPGISNDQYGLASMSGDSLYRIQSKVISQLADEGSCIFVGRTADYVLRDHPCVVSVFLHASDRHRINRICARGDAGNEKEASELLAKRDRQRQKYYDYYTGRRWGVGSTYDLCLNASDIDIKSIASIVIDYLNCKAAYIVNKI